MVAVRCGSSGWRRQYRSVCCSCVMFCNVDLLLGDLEFRRESEPVGGRCYCD